MVQIEFVDGNLHYVDHCRLSGRLDYYRFTNIFDNLIGALMLHNDDFFILHQVKEVSSDDDDCNDDDCHYDFVRIVFKSFDYTDYVVSDIVEAFLYSFKVTL